MKMGEAKPRVALVRGDERYSNVWKALNSIEEDIGLDGVQTIIIKPNLTSVTRQLAATHVDATRAVLDFLRQRTTAQIVIGEGSGGYGSSRPPSAGRTVSLYASARISGEVDSPGGRLDEDSASSFSVS